LLYAESEERWLLCSDPTGMDRLAYLSTDAMLPNSEQASWKTLPASLPTATTTPPKFVVCAAMNSKCSDGPPVTTSDSKLTRRNSVVFNSVPTVRGGGSGRRVCGSNAFLMMVVDL
jgi:hypothetical protein